MVGSRVVHALPVALLFLLPLLMTVTALPPDQYDAGRQGDAGDVHAEARDIVPGIHTGTFLGTDTTDWYRFAVEEGPVRVAVLWGEVQVLLVSPSGQTIHSGLVGSGASLSNAPAGEYHLRLSTDGRHVGDYRFQVQTGDLRLPDADPVVVATLDTGTNPFHPCLRAPDRTHPDQADPDHPDDSVPIHLTFADTFDASLQASQGNLSTIQPWTLHHFPGTKLSFYGSDRATEELVDTWPHGAQASSQIACDAYGMGGNAHLVVLNHYTAGWTPFVPFVHWLTQQDWIDVVHLNIQDLPNPVPGNAESRAIAGLIASGKMVILAAGNGVAGAGANYPMELSMYNGPAGSLVVGASDQDGYTTFSNMAPHVVADGMHTVAAAPSSFGTTTFSGTSSASPLVTGYVVRLLGALRAEWGHTGEGLLTIPDGSPRPASGPLADGELTAPEVHEVVRKTADPALGSSHYDGAGGSDRIPAPYAPGTRYAKAGYGKVGEQTVAAALDVASGRMEMPARPTEDAHFAASETVRRTYWGPLTFP